MCERNNADVTCINSEKAVYESRVLKKVAIEITLKRVCEDSERN